MVPKYTSYEVAPSAFHLSTGFALMLVRLMTG